MEEINDLFTIHTDITNDVESTLKDYTPEVRHTRTVKSNDEGLALYLKQMRPNEAIVVAVGYDFLVYTKHLSAQASDVLDAFHAELDADDVEASDLAVLVDAMADGAFYYADTIRKVTASLIEMAAHGQRHSGPYSTACGKLSALVEG